MNKRLPVLITLLTFGSFGVVGEDEFPIELTCETGGNIFYFNIERDEEKSWWKHHKGNWSMSRHGIYSRKWFENKNKSLKIITLNSEKIIVQMGNKFYPEILNLNRLTGISNIGITSGRCYKGFKEYKKQI